MIVSRRELVLVLGLFVVLALAFTWPLAARMVREIPTTPPATDAMLHLYALTWNVQALADNPLGIFQATFFYPYHSPLAFTDSMVGLAILVAPIGWAFRNMFVEFNAAWLLTFVISGLGAFLLVRYLTDSTTGGILAGILFMFHPYRYHNAGQINNLAFMWVPFAFLSLHLWVETRLRRHLFLFAAFSLAQFLSSAYGGVFIMVGTLLYVLVLLAVERRPFLELLILQRWIVLAVGSLVLVALIPFTAPYIRNAREEVTLRRSLGETALFSAKPSDFVSPAPQSLLGELAPSRPRARQPLFPGVVAVGLTAFWIARRGWRRQIHRPELIFYAVLTVAGGILAMGPMLEVLGVRIPLPFAAAWYVLPGISFIRAPVRFAVLASLGISVMAGAGIARLREKRRPALRWGTLGACALAAAELYAAPVELLRPLPHGVPAVYSWLGSVPGQLAILELPMPIDEAHEQVEHARYQLYSLAHRKRIANGIAAFVPPITRQLREEMQRFPDNSSVALLRELGITYVLVHTELYPPEEVERLRAAIEAHPGLALGQDVDGIWVVDVVTGTRGAN